MPCYQKVRVLMRNHSSKAIIMSRIGKAFLKAKNPSWTKVYKALKKAKFVELAKTIKVSFLPI